MRTIKTVYKIGQGPSSSHTVGPYHAAQTFGSRYPDADSYEVTLYGSLAFTGEGHGTGKAIREGLPGAEIVFNREIPESDLPHPNTMLFRAVQFSKALSQMDRRPAPQVMLSRFIQFLNASSGICVNLSDRTTDFNIRQSEKAPSAMETTNSGIAKCSPRRAAG